MKPSKNIDVEHRITAWFANHYGMISRPEALALGLTSAQIRARVRGSDWEVDHRGVYHLAGSPRDGLSALRGAVLLGGPAAAVSHGSAAWLWGLTSAPAEPTITVPHNRLARTAGVQVVRSRRPLQVVQRNRL